MQNVLSLNLQLPNDHLPILSPSMSFICGILTSFFSFKYKKLYQKVSTSFMSLSPLPVRPKSNGSRNRLKGQLLAERAMTPSIRETSTYSLGFYQLLWPDLVSVDTWTDHWPEYTRGVLGGQKFCQLENMRHKSLGKTHQLKVARCRGSLWSELSTSLIECPVKSPMYALPTACWSVDLDSQKRSHKFNTRIVKPAWIGNGNGREYSSEWLTFRKLGPEVSGESSCLRHLRKNRNNERHTINANFRSNFTNRNQQGANSQKLSSREIHTSFW